MHQRPASAALAVAEDRSGQEVLRAVKRAGRATEVKRVREFLAQYPRITRLPPELFSINARPVTIGEPQGFYTPVLNADEAEVFKERTGCCSEPGCVKVAAHEGAHS